MKMKKEWMQPRLMVHGKVEEITKEIPDGYVKDYGKGDDMVADELGDFSCCCPPTT